MRGMILYINKEIGEVLSLAFFMGYYSVDFYIKHGESIACIKVKKVIKGYVFLVTCS